MLRITELNILLSDHVTALNAPRRWLHTLLDRYFGHHESGNDRLAQMRILCHSVWYIVIISVRSFFGSFQLRSNTREINFLLLHTFLQFCSPWLTQPFYHLCLLRIRLGRKFTFFWCHTYAHEVPRKQFSCLYRRLTFDLHRVLSYMKRLVFRWISTYKSPL